MGLDRGEHYSLLLFSLVGMMGLVSATELVSLFVALEIMSIALYGLVGLRRDRPESQEAALKYFVTGAFSSAFFLYGVALLYGVAGSTRLDRIALAAARPGPGEQGLALLGIGFLLVGFGFKVASVPFHMWAPDVYEGAPTTVTAFMAAGVKVAAFGALLRIFGQALAPLAVRVAARGGRPRGGDHGRRQPGRARPDQPEADARLFLHRPRRLPAHRARGALGAGGARGPLLPRRLRGGEPGRLRGRSPPSPGTATSRCRYRT